MQVILHLFHILLNLFSNRRCVIFIKKLDKANHVSLYYNTVFVDSLGNAGWIRVFFISRFGAQTGITGKSGSAAFGCDSISRCGPAAVMLRMLQGKR